MKNNGLKGIFVNSLMILLVAGTFVVAAAANDRNSDRAGGPLIARCNSRSISGNYGMTVNAMNLVPPSTSIPIVAVGLVSFDGEGRLSGTATTSFGGGVGTDSVTGTYTVESNCTGTFSVTFSNGFTINHNLVIVDEGKEIIFIQTDQGTVTTGRFRRQ